MENVIAFEKKYENVRKREQKHEKKFWDGYEHAKKGESGKFLIGSLGHKKYEMKKDRIT